MFKVLHYYGRYQGLRGNVASLPTWGKPLLVLAALPGIVLIALSIALFLVSLLALLLLTVPVYRILQAFTAGRPARPQEVVVESPRPDDVFTPTGPRRQVEVKIVE